MGSVTSYESRTGILNYNAEDVYDFVTDIRNFKRFIPSGSFNDIEVDKDSCRFNAGMLGEVNLSISEKIVPGKVTFSGNARQVNDFSIDMQIRNTGESRSEVKIILSADMNPLLKMVADEPVKQFLDKLVDEMERFNDWKVKYYDR